MQKRIFSILAVAITLLVASCVTSKQARQYEQHLNGNWHLKTVVSEGISGKVKTMLFNEADFNCFIGTNWNFNQRNNLGSYTILKNATECEGIKREFRWSIYEAPGEPKLFQFKRLDGKLKELDENGAGFRFTILQLDQQVLKLKSEIIFEGKPAAFIYNFVKI